jgi:aconitate hydratase
MAAAHPNSFKARKTLKVGGKSYTYFSLKAVEKEVGDLSRLPFSLRVLLENLVRHEDGTTVKKGDIAAFADWLKNGGRSVKEINFRPARVLMQDFTGVPAVVDLAAMRDAMGKLGGDAKKINPLVPVDLVIDHSVIVDNRAPSAPTSSSSMNATSSAISSCAGVRWRSTISASCRRAPASATR